MITIVSGLPRSGTSLMMQMLYAGGMPVLTDAVREPDEDNPRGYLEWEPAKRLRQEPKRISEAEGKVVKVVSPLLASLPSGHAYSVIFMLRPINEILRSQAEMKRRRLASDSRHNEQSITEAYQKHLVMVFAWIEHQSNVQSLRLDYAEVIRNPMTQVKRLQKFVGLDLDLDAMIGAVDPSLHRQHAPAEAFYDMDKGSDLRHG